MVEFSERYMWIDPLEDEAGGILLSDQIEYYVNAVKLIDPFQQTCLRPASYDLTVGEDYFVNDCGKHLQKGEKITISPNGLVYIKTREFFNLPYYIVARYSLRVQQVYRGLLVDNGLHVDPGYRGPITIPVHNLTDDKRELSYGEPFLSVDFSRTTRFKPTILDSIASEDELVKEGVQLVGTEGYELKLFWKSAESFKKPKGVYDLWIAGETHKSSLEKMREDLDSNTKIAKKLTRAWSSFKKVGYIAGLALVITLFSVLLVHIRWSVDKYTDVLEKVEQVEAEVGVLQERDSQSEAIAKEVHELNSRVKALEMQQMKPQSKK